MKMDHRRDALADWMGFIGILLIGGLALVVLEFGRYLWERFF